MRERKLISWISKLENHLINSYIQNVCTVNYKPQDISNSFEFLFQVWIFPWHQLQGTISETFSLYHFHGRFPTVQRWFWNESDLTGTAFGTLILYIVQYSYIKELKSNLQSQTEKMQITEKHAHRQTSMHIQMCMYMHICWGDCGGWQSDRSTVQ